MERSIDAARSASGRAISGASGKMAAEVNGTFFRVPGERKPGGAPVYKRVQASAAGNARWLFLSRGRKKWRVSHTQDKDERKDASFAVSADAVAAGTLPHEVSSWSVWDGVKGGPWNVQSSVTVRAVL